jgi:hypothetical protein
MKQLFILVALAAGSLSLAAQPYAYVANFGSNPGTISVIKTLPPIPSLVHFGQHAVPALTTIAEPMIDQVRGL